MSETGSKTFLVTGAASGIGAATAELLVGKGHRVLMADINAQGAQRVASRLGALATSFALDICSEQQWELALDFAWKEYGHLDVLVNNAAIVHTGYARDVSIEKHAQTMAVNFMGPLTGMLKALPRFKAQGSGHLVTVCSMTAYLPFPGIASYASSKHALRAFHYALAIEERKSNVSFSMIHPTSTETPMLDKEAEDDAMALAFAGPSTSAQHVAEVIHQAIELNTFETFIPPERGVVVRKVGIDPVELLAMVERNEVIGRERLLQRREANATPARQ